MKKIERQILDLINEAFVANIQAKRTVDDDERKYLYRMKENKIVEALTLRFHNKTRIRIGSSADKTVLYVQFHHKQASFHRGLDRWYGIYIGYKLFRIPPFKGARKKRRNTEDFRF